MLRGVLGKKIGMTQVFSDNKVIPVTVVDLNHWYVTGIKTSEKDGYDAVQVALLRPRFRGQEFSTDWLKDLKKYFSSIREVERIDLEQEVVVGQPVDFATLVGTGDLVNVFGITKGHGFQGVVKRHGYSGGPASHGPRLGRAPGSIGFMRSQGRVVKGTKLPGHMGVRNRMTKNLEIVRIEPDSKIALVKGSVPGNAGSVIFIQKV